MTDDWKHLMFSPDGSRKNFASKSGINTELVHRVWDAVFDKNFKIVKLLKGPIGSGVRVEFSYKKQTGELPLKKALNLGVAGIPSYLEAKQHGVSYQGAKTQTIEELQSYVDRRFGENSVKVLSRRRAGKSLWFVKIRDVSSNKTVEISLGNLRDRTLKESLFAADVGLLVRNRKRASRLLDREAFAQRLIEGLGLTETYEFVRVESRDFIFCHKPTGKEFPISIYSAQSEISEARDVIRRAGTWIRYGKRVPVKFTDAEWRDKVKKASSGNIVPAAPYPYPEGVREYKLRCLRCDIRFSVPRLFNKKHAVVRCPDCDRKQHRNFSTQSLNWLRDLEGRFNIRIQKATDSQGEFSIKLGTKATSVDGYCKKGKIVFEYHGSRWHGNPLIFYADDKPSPYSNKTSKQLLLETMKRELAITDQGFNLVRIWDQDFLSKDRYEQWLLLNTQRVQKFLTQQ